MAIKTVLFDLDGTLLPMDQEVFVKDYLTRLSAYMAQYGYDPKLTAQTVMEGVYVMVKNDGSVSNEEVFWRHFCSKMGEYCKEDIPKFEEFYCTEFQKAAASCGFNTEAKNVIELVKSLGYDAVLATNPLFPQIATYSRIRWAGLQPEDFIFITTYENSSFCKPNPLYYRQIMDKLGLNAEECVMVGNDAREDTVPAQFGMKVFLLCDCLINKGEDIDKYAHGDFEALKRFLKEV